MHRDCHRLLLADVTCSCKGWNERRALLCGTRRHPQTRVVIVTRKGHARDRGRSSRLTVQGREGHAWIMGWGGRNLGGRYVHLLCKCDVGAPGSACGRRTRAKERKVQFL